MSSGEIVLKFFRFYSLHFDPWQNAIDISQSMTQKVVEPLTMEKAQELLYEGHSIVNKSKLAEFLKNEFVSGKYLKKLELIDNEDNKKKIADFAWSNYLGQSNAYTYLTLDPFNHTYTPAKNIRLLTREDRQMTDNLYQYNNAQGRNINVFEDAFRSILTHDKLEFKCYSK